MRPFDLGLVRDEPIVRRPLAALGVIGVVQGLLAIAQALIVARLIVAVVRGQGLVAPATAVLIVFGLRAATSGVAERVAAWAGSYVANVLRHRAIEAWLRRTIDTRPSETVMLSRATEGAQAVEPYVARYLPALISAAVVPGFALVALVCTDWVSALIVVLTVPLLPLFAALIGMHTRDATAARWQETDRMTGHFLDVMRGLPTLVNFQRAGRQVRVVREVGDRLRRATVRTLRIAFLSSAALELLATISVAIVAVAVGLRLVHGEMGLGVGLTAILLAPEAYWPIRRVGQEFHAAADGAQAIEELRDEVRRYPPDKRGHRTEAVVRATGLGYRYPGTERVVLDSFHLEAGAGLTVLAGESGAGKSTVLDLLAGLRTPSAGTVDRPAALHYTRQRPFLVPGTLGDNLALAGPLPAGTDWLPEPLRRLPGGLGTRIGDDGFGLSAGQRALLSLTRARLSGASVLLLDEPTAHLDPQMRRLAEEVIRELAVERTVLVATHSESLIALAGTVIRLGGGRVGDFDTSIPRFAPPALLSHRGAGDPVLISHRGVADPVLVGHRGFGGLDAGSPSGARPARPPHRSQAASSVWRPAPGVVRAAMVGALASSCGVALTATSGWLIVQAAARPPVLTLLVAIVCVRAFGIGRPVLRYVERVCSHDAALADLVGRRARLFARLIPLTPARLGRRRRSDVLTAAVSDLDDEVDLQVRALVPLIGAGGTAVIAVAVIAALHPMSGLVLAGVVLCAAAVAWWDFRLERSAHRHTLRARAGVHREAQLITTNLPAVQAICVSRPLLDRLEDAAAAALRATGRQARGRAVGMALSTFLAGCGVVATALVARSALAAGSVEPAIAALLVLGPLALTEVLGDLPDAVGAAARGVQARHRLDELTTRPPAVHDAAPHAATIARPAEVRLHVVQATWTGQHADLAIDGLRLRPGERVSVIGPNGAGKSTLLSVLARHLETSSGSYEFAGLDVRSLPLAAVRSRIAIVDDEPHVFTGTVRANLLLARPEAGDADVARSLVDAGLGGWLAALPHGLDTELGAARSISGGERTRLAIARAILSGRELLLLDEPVAHLDTATARKVLADLRAATSATAQTVVAVSHQAVDELRPERVVVIRPPAATEKPCTAGWVQRRAESAAEDTVASW